MGHRACFHAKMLTNTVIKVTFGDLRAQQISAIIFQCGVLYHTEFDFLDCLFIYVPEKMASNTLHYKLIFLSLEGNIIWTCSVGPVKSLSVALFHLPKK